MSSSTASQLSRRKPDSSPSKRYTSSEMDVQEARESYPAGRAKRKKHAEQTDDEQGEREEEREIFKRKKPIRTGTFNKPKCERCEKSGRSCEKQKAGVACYECALSRSRCEPQGESGRKPFRRNAPIAPTVKELLAAPLVALETAPQREQSSSPAPEIYRPGLFHILKSAQMNPVRDKHHYHESGDLAFVVGDILFKIHRFQLERCSSSLTDNPLLRSGQQLPKENKPRVLQDKVEEFRALCWALYAPPQETALQYNAPNFKLKLILDLFLISHKYRLDSLQTFATQLLVYHCTPPKTTCRTPELESILRVATRNKALPLIEIIEQALLCRLEDDQTITTAELIKLAEELDMRRFQGKLYYHALVKEQSSPISKIPSSTAYDIPGIDLSEKQSMALFRGYRSLLRYWQNLPGEAREKKLSQLTSCKDHHKCQSEWDSAWSVEAFKNRDPFPPNLDILAALEKIQTSAPEGIVTPAPIVLGGPSNARPWMRPCGQKELSGIIEKLKDTLADHFLGSQFP
ncbi:hypothetical protein M413DRAFT_157626 [Hebeloma cylindrosporum]|uniref:Zn(2)-C6 fungal-type domain-containing protein n=1 Tax=Hebeloma cylindrosporum TaxID=76867 RepID=A0A0C3CBJ9_HEBCY|nr:hypothetical protein M413DRAFT_157626 [Hebeloma cylindrosporum h7]